jgi:hypothetical protein
MNYLDFVYLRLVIPFHPHGLQVSNSGIILVRVGNEVNRSNCFVFENN